MGLVGRKVRCQLQIGGRLKLDNHGERSHVHFAGSNEVPYAQTEARFPFLIP